MGEATSIYRYVKCIIERTTIQDETTSLIKEIDQFQFQQQQAKTPDADPRNIATTANEALDKLSREVDQRVTMQGSSGVLIAQILKRNVEKLKLINDLRSAVEKAKMDLEN